MSNAQITYETSIINDPGATIGAKVAAAAKLWQLVEDCQEVIEAFKTEVRKVAAAEGKPTVMINGEGLSQCKVVFPRPSLKLKEHLDIDNERAALGDLFDALFEVRIQLRKADPTFVATFPQSVQAHISNVTTLVTNPPRVSLMVLPGVEEIK